MSTANNELTFVAATNTFNVRTHTFTSDITERTQTFVVNMCALAFIAFSTLYNIAIARTYIHTYILRAYMFRALTFVY